MSASNRGSGVKRPAPSPRIKVWLQRRINGHVIELGPGTTVLGRGSVTGIDDPRCSKRQAEFTVDPEQETVHIAQLGKNACRLGTRDLEKGVQYVVRDGDQVSLMPTKEPMYTLHIHRDGPGTTKKQGAITDYFQPRPTESQGSGRSARLLKQTAETSHAAESALSQKKASPARNMAPTQTSPERSMAPSQKGHASQADGAKDPCALANMSYRDLNTSPEHKPVLGSLHSTDGALSSAETGPRVAFPSLSTSVGMFDPFRAVGVLVRVLADFLAQHDAPMRLVLVDHDPVIKDTFAKEWRCRDPRVVVSEQLWDEALTAGHYGYYAAEVTWMLKPAGPRSREALAAFDKGQVEMLYKASGVKLEAGRAVVLGPTQASVLHMSAAKLICVVSANMNPARPDCLNDDYDAGEEILAKAYTNLFSAFLSDARSIATGNGSQRSVAELEAEMERFVDPLFHGQRRSQDKRMEFLDSLIVYINNPEAHAADIYHQDNACMVIKDKYPKAAHHYLIFPKRPIDYPSQLTEADLPLLHHLQRRATWLIVRLQRNGPAYKFKAGFHAKPSIKHLHVHVISQDFSAPGLRNKKHWNSFTTDFFVPIDQLVRELETAGKITTKLRSLEQHLADPLRCHICRREQKNMPKLKEHIHGMHAADVLAS